MDELPSLWATLAVRSLANASAKLAGLLLDVIHVHVRFLEAKMDEDGNDDWKFRPAFDVLRSLAGAQSRSVWSIDDYADRRHSRPAALAAIGTLGMGLVFHGRSAELVPTFADPTYLCLQLGGDLVCSPSLVEWVNGRPAHKLLGLGPSTVESEKPVAWKDNELAYLPNGLLLVSVWLSSRFEEVAPRVCKATRLSAVLECLTWPGLSCGDENAQCPIILTFVASAPLSLVMGACSSDRTPDGRHWAAHVPQLAGALMQCLTWMSADQSAAIRQRATAVLAARLKESVHGARVQQLVAELLPALGPTAPRYEPKPPLYPIAILKESSSERCIFQAQKNGVSETAPFLLIKFVPADRSDYAFSNLALTAGADQGSSVTIDVGDVSEAALKLLVEYLVLGKVRPPCHSSLDAPRSPHGDHPHCVLHLYSTASPTRGNAKGRGDPGAAQAGGHVQGTEASGSCITSGYESLACIRWAPPIGKALGDCSSAWAARA